MDIDSWHYVNSSGTTIRVSTETRKEIEAWMRQLAEPEDHFASICVTTIEGEEITIYADSINHIYDSTPEIRRIQRQANKDLRAERESQEFFDD